MLAGGCVGGDNNCVGNGYVVMMMMAMVVLLFSVEMCSL